MPVLDRETSQIPKPQVPIARQAPPKPNLRPAWQRTKAVTCYPPRTFVTPRGSWVSTSLSMQFSRKTAKQPPPAPSYKHIPPQTDPSPLTHPKLTETEYKRILKESYKLDEVVDIGPKVDGKYPKVLRRTLKEHLDSGRVIFDRFQNLTFTLIDHGERTHHCSESRSDYRLRR